MYCNRKCFVSQRRCTVTSPPRGMTISPALPLETRVSMLEPHEVCGWTRLHLVPLGDAGDRRRILRTFLDGWWSDSGSWLCVYFLVGAALCLDQWLYWKDRVASLDVTCFHTSWVFYQEPRLCSWPMCFDLLCLIFVFIGDGNAWPSLSIPVESGDFLWYCSWEFHGGLSK